MEVAIQKDTKQSILDIAEDLLHQKGYNAFSYKDIAVALGIKNASIHYYFPSKEDLGEAVVLYAFEKLKKLQEKAQAKNLSPPEELDFFLSIYQHYLEKKLKIGLIGTLAVNFAAIPEKMQIAGQKITQTCIAWLQSILEKGRASQTLRFEGDSFAQALLILASLEGALQIARLTDNQHFYQIVGQLRNSLILSITI
ncbi:MAG: TetR/AcrR family transcriptional regulator [Microscillaceae bacterium]|jgi:AcrR family transcriptional regulator|nr:TetR/AcrR family transcriptional regulator [Microscillaceae bacterium]